MNLSSRQSVISQGISLYFDEIKQVHSLCVDSRPGERSFFAKGPPSSSSSLIILLSTVWSSRPAFGDGREKNN